MLQGLSGLDKDAALKVLGTNIHRQLVKRWFFYDSMSIIPIIVVYFVPIQLPTLILPPAILKIENVVPPIFTGTITAISILIGFFSVSAFNFHQWFERSVQFFQEARPRVSTMLKSQLEDKDKLEKKRNTVNPDEVEKLNEDIASVDASIGETSEYLELIDLNIDACSHEQEHISIFMVTFLSVGVLLTFFIISSFLLTVASSVIDGYFVIFDMCSLNTMFIGLILFMSEFMSFRGHKERY